MSHESTAPKKSTATSDHWRIVRIGVDGSDERWSEGLSHAMTLTAASVRSREDPHHLYEVRGARGLIARFWRGSSVES